MSTQPQTNAVTADSSVEVLFLTGQPGAGKSAVAKELSELLWRSRQPHAVIDIDELCRGVLPDKSSDFNRSLAVANLKAVWANFYTAGVRRVILCRILETADDLDQFSSAIPHAHITVCLLQVAQETVQRRITHREAGSARAFLLSVTSRIAERIASLDLAGITVDNNQRPLNEVAREILDRVGWSVQPPV